MAEASPATRWNPVTPTRVGLDRAARTVYAPTHGPAYALHELCHLHTDHPDYPFQWGEHFFLAPVERAIARDLFPSEFLCEVVYEQERIGGGRLPFRAQPWWPESIALAIRAGLLTPEGEPTYTLHPHWHVFSKTECLFFSQEGLPAPFVVEAAHKGAWYSAGAFLTRPLAEEWLKEKQAQRPTDVLRIRENPHAVLEEALPIE